MFDMQLTNYKLVNRAVNMIMESTQVDAETAQKLLDENGSVRKAVDWYRTNAIK